ncbi:MAG TPA: aminoglycoside phosphotransferase family protein [Edaphocola sp.]|nr:aminoglycoside phosphotransferase family protein [Edaphocola sp.]
MKTATKTTTLEIQNAFNNFEQIAADFKATQLTSGHINQTFKVHNHQKDYILQKVNTDVFNNLEGITLNIHSISQHLKSNGYPQPILTPINFQSGSFLHEEKWRLFNYFEDIQSFEKVQNQEQAFEAAKFLGEFHFYLKDFDADSLKESIKGFTNFEARILQFKESLNTASPERLDLARKEISFLLAQTSIIDQWQKIVQKTPKRLIHADPKISNFLFNKNTSTQIKAIIDWDTIMCGTILYDFGDMVRSFTNLKEEDDSKIGNNFNYDYYKAIKQGFLHHLASELKSIEIDNLDLAAKTVVLIQAIRFLTDYLNNDTYYATKYPNHNLLRAKNQLNLFSEIVEHT